MGRHHVSAWPPDANGAVRSREFGRDLILQRTNEGCAHCMTEGKRFGRRPKLTKHQAREALPQRAIARDRVELPSIVRPSRGSWHGTRPSSDSTGRLRDLGAKFLRARRAALSKTRLRSAYKNNVCATADNYRGRGPGGGTYCVLRVQ
jgi:hypothetical protein